MSNGEVALRIVALLVFGGVLVVLAIYALREARPPKTSRELTVPAEAFRLVQTFPTAPEEYDVYFCGNKLGTMRLWNGTFKVFKIDDDRPIFTSQPQGSMCFCTEERVSYLNQGCLSLIQPENTAKASPLYTLEVREPKSKLYITTSKS